MGCVVAAPLVHFHTSLSLLLSALFLISSLFLPPSRSHRRHRAVAEEARVAASSQPDPSRRAGATAADPAVQVWVPLQKRAVVAVGAIGHEPVRRTGRRRRRRTISATSHTRPPGGRCRALARLPGNPRGAVARVRDVAHARRAAAGGAVRQHRVGRADLLGAVAVLGDVAALADRRRHAHRAARLDRVGRAGLVACRRRLRPMSQTSPTARRGTRRRRLDRIGRAVVVDPVAVLGDVAYLAALDARHTCGRLAVRRAVGARRRCRSRPRRSRRPRGAAHVSPAHRVRRAVVVHAVADLGDVADAGRARGIPPRHLRIGRTVVADAVATSATSQTPPARGRRRALGVGRTVVADAVAVSATSQTPPRRGTPPCSWRRPGSCCSSRRSSRRGRRRRPRRGTAPCSWRRAGQSLPTPSQLSATSQTPADGAAARRALGVGRTVRAPTPSQFSARSQTPAAARHTAVLDGVGRAVVADAVAALRDVADARPRRGNRRALGVGRTIVATPSQLSATSQTPAAGRQTGALRVGRQAPLVPLQVSARSHTPALARHGVDAGTNVQSLAQQNPGRRSPGPRRIPRGGEAPSPHTMGFMTVVTALASAVLLALSMMSAELNRHAVGERRRHGRGDGDGTRAADGKARDLPLTVGVGRLGDAGAGRGPAARHVGDVAVEGLVDDDPARVAGAAVTDRENVGEDLPGATGSGESVLLRVNAIVPDTVVVTGLPAVGVF